jgi:HEAT repeat protein
MKPSRTPLKLMTTLKTESTEPTMTLDEALRKGNVAQVENLLKEGKKQFEIIHALKFIETYQLSYISLCQKLLQANSDLLWEYALVRLRQEKPTPGKLQAKYFSPLDKEPIYMENKILKIIFSQAHHFPYEEPYIDGQQKNQDQIGLSLCGLQTIINLEKKPRFFIQEMMTSTLARLLFGNKLTPQTRLFRFTELNKEDPFGCEFYPVLASRHDVTSKITLEYALTQPDLLESIDKDSIFQAILLSMLVNPENGRYILEPYTQEEKIHYRLVHINNGHSFVPPLRTLETATEQQTGETLAIKNILYCLDEMGECLPDQLKGQLSSIKPKELLEIWLEELQLQQKITEQLFSTSERRTLKDQGGPLDITFAKSTLLEIYQKLQRIQLALKEDPHCTLMQLLRKVTPALGIHYRDIFENHDEIQERFNELTRKYFAYETVISEQEEKKEETRSPKQLQKYLTSVPTTTNLRKIQGELYYGKTRSFKQLQNPDDQEGIINGLTSGLSGLNFGLMTTTDGQIDYEKQQRILKEMEDIPFQQLVLRGCSALTDELLQQTLKSCQNLESLTLSLTPNTSQSLAIIATQSPQIEYLRLAHLKIFYFRKLDETYPFKQLRILQIDDCENLQLLPIDAIRLNELILTDCPNFKHKDLFIAYPFLLKYSGFLNHSTKIWVEQLSETIKQKINNNESTKEKSYAQLSIKEREQLSEFTQNTIDETAKQINDAIDSELEETQKLQILVKAGQAQPAIIEFVYETLQNTTNATTIENSVETLLNLLELTTNLPERLIDALKTHLESEILENRIAATKALGELAEKMYSKKLIPLLISRLEEDEHAKVRITAITVLAKLTGTVDLTKLMRLLRLRLLGESNKNVREAAANTAGKIAEKADPAELMPLLKLWLEDQDDNVNRAATSALNTLAETADPAKLMPKLKPWLADRNPIIRSAATSALNKLAETADPAKLMPELKPWLEAGDINITPVASFALKKLAEKIDPENEELISLLKSWLEDVSPHVNEAAAKALCELAKKMSLTDLEALLNLLKEKHIQKVADLLNTMAKERDDFVNLMPWIHELLLNSQTTSQATSALNKLAEKADPAELMPKLKLWLADGNPIISRAATSALNKSVETANPATLMHLLKPWLADGNQSVYQAATSALNKLVEEKATTKELIPELRAWLTGGGLFAPKAATDILVRLAKKIDANILMPLLNPWSTDTNPALNQAMTSAFNELAKTTDPVILISLLKPWLENDIPNPTIISLAMTSAKKANLEELTLLVNEWSKDDNKNIKTMATTLKSLISLKSLDDTSSDTNHTTQSFFSQRSSPDGSQQTRGSSTSPSPQGTS